MSDVLGDLDATALADLVRRDEVKAVELIDAAIARIEALDGQLNSVIHRQFERARRDASGDLPVGPFTGVPFLFKDLGCEESGEPHHQGMRALRDAGWRATVDGELAGAFRSAGVIPLGRTNVPELALMGTTEPDAYGPTHNPWDLGRSPGGSSGGSAAAVAAGLVPAAHATDIAGSIRIPAAQCGLVGLKPTRGRVVSGRAGDYAVGMNTEGVLTRSVRDIGGAARRDRRVGDRAARGRRPRCRVRCSPRSAPIQAGCGSGCACGRSTTRTSTRGVRRRRSDAARLLEQLGHDVEEDAPAALFDPDLLAGSRTCSPTHAAAEVDSCGPPASAGRSARRTSSRSHGGWSSRAVPSLAPRCSPSSTASTSSPRRR